MTDREPLPSAYATRTELREAQERILKTFFNNLVDTTKNDHYSMLQYWLHDGCYLTDTSLGLVVNDKKGRVIIYIGKAAIIL